MPHRPLAANNADQTETIIFVFYKTSYLSYVLYKTILASSKRFCFAR